MVFHLGALWRLNERGYLPDLPRLQRLRRLDHRRHSGCLERLEFGAAGSARASSRSRRAIRMAATHDGYPRQSRPASSRRGRSAAVSPPPTAGICSEPPPCRICRATEGPRFVINATNLQSGVLWRFSALHLGDYRVGEIPNRRSSSPSRSPPPPPSRRSSRPCACASTTLSTGRPPPA